MSERGISARMEHCGSPTAMREPHGSLPALLVFSFIDLYNLAVIRYTSETSLGQHINMQVNLQRGKVSKNNTRCCDHTRTCILQYERTCK